MSRKEAIPDRGGRPRMLLQQQAQVHKRRVARISMWRRPFTGYLFSIPFFALISLGILRVQRLFPHFYFFEGPLLLAVMVIALIWGVGPALFSALISTAALAYFYIPAFQSLNFTTWDDVLPIVPFFFSGVILAVITGQRESARRRAHIAEQRSRSGPVNWRQLLKR